MITTILNKIRGLIADLEKSDYQSFTYSTSAVFKIGRENVDSVTGVLKNGSALSSGDYSYDSTTQEVTVSASLTANDIIRVNYTYYKYSDTELKGYVRAALVYLSVYSYTLTGDEDFELETDDIYPTPTNKDTDVIALIASIIVKPDYSLYKTSTVEVRYPRTMRKEERIKEFIQAARWAIGDIGIIEFD